ADSMRFSEMSVCGLTVECTRRQDRAAKVQRSTHREQAGGDRKLFGCPVGPVDDLRPTGICAGVEQNQCAMIFRRNRPYRVTTAFGGPYAAFCGQSGEVEVAIPIRQRRSEEH